MSSDVQLAVYHAPPLETRVEAILKRSSAVGLAVGVVRNGRGLADISDNW